MWPVVCAGTVLLAFCNVFTGMPHKALADVGVGVLASGVRRARALAVARGRRWSCPVKVGRFLTAVQQRRNTT